MNILRKKIGQMLIMGFEGSEITPNHSLIDWIRKDCVGGVLLFDYDLKTKQQGKNLISKTQIFHLTQTLNSISEGVLPLWIAIDYEGGAVDRLKKIDGCIKTISPEQQSLLDENSLIKEYRQMACTLKSLGFNLNFAPVLDLNLNHQEGIIGKLGRSFSKDPKIVVKLANQFVNIFNNEGISCCYKHFPGHGSALGDTHEGYVDVTLHFDDTELFPYQQLKNNDQLSMVMTAHVVNKKLDPSGLPATLSKKILNELLREQIGFNGVIVSDDLQMQAISKHYSLEESLTLSINAGADMLIFANQIGSNTPSEIIDCIEMLVNSGKISIERINSSFERIEQLKSKSVGLQIA